MSKFEVSNKLLPIITKSGNILYIHGSIETKHVNTLTDKGYFVVVKKKKATSGEPNPSLAPKFPG